MHAGERELLNEQGDRNKGVALLRHNAAAVQDLCAAGPTPSLVEKEGPFER